WNDVINAVWITVGIHDANGRDANLLGFLDGDDFALLVDDEQNIRLTAHVLDTAKRLVEFEQLAVKNGQFFFRAAIELTAVFHLFQLFEPVDAQANGLKISEHSTQPASIDKEAATALRLFFNNLGRLFFGTYENYVLPFGSGLPNEIAGAIKRSGCLFEVDDIDTVTLTIYIRLHFRIPTAGFVVARETHVPKQSLFCCLQSVTSFNFPSPVHPLSP